MFLDRSDREALAAIVARTGLTSGDIKIVMEYDRVYVLSETDNPYCGRDSEWFEFDGLWHLIAWIRSESGIGDCFGPYHKTTKKMLKRWEEKMRKAMSEKARGAISLTLWVMAILSWASVIAIIFLALFHVIELSNKSGHIPPTAIGFGIVLGLEMWAFSKCVEEDPPSRSNLT